MSSDSELTEQLIDAFLHDIQTQSARRATGRHVAGISGQFESTPPLIYTAFDGDHFALVPLMRQYVLGEGAVPVNPESIVGYKDALDTYQTKEGVLEADLALVAKCDEIWVFSDLPGDARGLRALPEGVATELLFYLKCQRVPRIRHIEIGQLLASFAKPPTPPVPFDLPVDQIERELLLGRNELLSFVNGIRQDLLPDIVFCLYDPLDSKYAHWIRSESHRRHTVAIAPTLAIELGDAGGTRAGLGRVLASWAALLGMADRAWHWDSIDERPTSRLQLALAHLLTLNGVPIDDRAWYEFEIPKATNAEEWALTERERAGQRRKTA